MVEPVVRVPRSNRPVGVSAVNRQQRYVSADACRVRAWRNSMPPYPATLVTVCRYRPRRTAIPIAPSTSPASIPTGCVPGCLHTALKITVQPLKPGSTSSPCSLSRSRRPTAPPRLESGLPHGSAACKESTRGVPATMAGAGGHLMEHWAESGPGATLSFSGA